MFLFLLVAMVLVVAFLFIMMNTNQPDAVANTEIQAPDNSTGKAIPRLYGISKMYGNNIYYGGLTAYPIKEDDGK